MLEPSTFPTTELDMATVERAGIGHHAAMALLAEEREHDWDGPAVPCMAQDVRDDPRDLVPSEIIDALTARAVRVFDLRTAAVIGHAGVEGRIRVRIDDARWSLSPLEASLVAVLLRLGMGLAHADLFADAFCRAAIQAENKVEAVHLAVRSGAEGAV